MASLRRVLLASMVVLLLPVGALAGPTDPVTVTLIPQIPPVLDTDPVIFSPGIRLVADLVQPYVEEEFFVEGAATVFTYNEVPVPGEIIPFDVDVPYVTRIIVRRPVDPAKFKGTVVIEWWNSTAGFDTAPAWDASAEFFAREGWIYVGVTNASNTIAHLVSGCSLFAGILPSTCLGRYDTPSLTLSMPENGQAYEMVSQIANLLKSTSPENPIPPEFGYVERIFHAGQSQQGGSMVTYATAFHSVVNDGYFVQAASSARRIKDGTSCSDVAALPYPDCTPQLTGDDRRVRTDLPVPVYRAMTETDIGCGPPFCDGSTDALRPRGVIGGASRQTDVGKFRYYEMPGTAHTPVHKNVEVLPPIRFFLPDGLSLEDTCLHPLNTLADGPVFGSHLYNAMWKNMEWQSRFGVPAPHADLIDVVDGAIVRDEFDNALGGIRVSMMEVPIATYGPHNTIDTENVPAPLQGLLGLFCVLSGTRADFDAATLAELYPTHGHYVGKVSHSVLVLFLQRFMLLEDVASVIHDARESDIGNPVSGCGIGFELVFVLPPLIWLHKRRRRFAYGEGVA
ncbi:MAG: hypothetical protein IH884_10895 [Myxococcales bacterium]|nr:hypothetical protein [Myxococcales bacterium]